MSRATFFYQECPTCGRSLRVAVRHFGREMSCSHCHGEFLAGPPPGNATSQAFTEPPRADSVIFVGASHQPCAPTLGEA